MRYLILGLLVFGVNLLPAFGPPTWSLLVYARLRWHFDPVLLAVLGAFAASAGRWLLEVVFYFLPALRSERCDTVPVSSVLDSWCFGNVNPAPRSTREEPFATRTSPEKG